MSKILGTPHFTWRYTKTDLDDLLKRLATHAAEPISTAA
jgi:hypothetical protein